MRNAVSFYLNGTKKVVSGEDIFLSLSSYLRYQVGLTGTKVVCAEGDCGACTVMVAKWRPTQQIPSEYLSINSCIARVFSMDGASIITVEGLTQNSAKKNVNQERCSEVQESMIRNFGGQCGFCTPGFVMSITNMLENKSTEDLPEKLTGQKVKNYLTGNLCRCTGYAPIVQAALDVDINRHVRIKDKYPTAELFPYLSTEMQESISVFSPTCEFFAPISLTEACAYKEKYPEAILFSGATDLGVQVNKGHLQPKKILSLHLIKELYICNIEDSCAVIGAGVTLSEFQNLIKSSIPSLDNFLNIFASPQIKNIGTLVGNLANASPIADMTPALMALDAKLIIQGKKGRITKSLQDFYLGYKKINLQKDEIIVQIRFHIPDQQHKLKNYKVSQRRDLDISTVNASFNFVLNATKIKTARIVFGGVAANTLRLTAVEKELEGQDLNLHTLASLKKIFSHAIKPIIKPISDVRGSVEYRTLLVTNLFEKFAREQLGL